MSLILRSKAPKKPSGGRYNEDLWISTAPGCQRQDQQRVKVRELVEAIVKALVDRPDDVVVTEGKGTYSCVIELQVAAEDVGKVIGKKGVQAKATRRNVHAVGGKKRKRYVLEIIEDRHRR